MKIVINNKYGGYSLSPKAVKRLAELQGKECFFYERDILGDKKYHKKTLKEATGSFVVSAFTVDDEEKMNELLVDSDWPSMSQKQRDKHNEDYKKVSLDERPDDRTGKLLIQVVEELGKEADGRCAKLKIIEIPDDVEWTIEEYDGIEWVAEKHRTWH